MKANISLCRRQHCREPSQRLRDDATMLLNAADDLLGRAFIHLGGGIRVDRLQVEHGGIDVGGLGLKVFCLFLFFPDFLGSYLSFFRRLNCSFRSTTVALI